MDKTCPICLDELKSPEETVCKHKFCGSCLKLWKKGHSTCPTCRTAITSGTDGMEEEVAVYLAMRRTMADISRAEHRFLASNFRVSDVHQFCTSSMIDNRIRTRLFGILGRRRP